MPTYYAPGTRKGNRFYVIRGSINGKEREITTRTRDKRVAKQAWDKYAPAEREREKSGPRTLETFGDVANAYLQVTTRSRGDQRYIKRLVGEIGKIAIGNVKPDDIYQAAVRLYPDAVNSTRNRQAVKPAAAILHYAHDNDLRGWLRVKRLKEPQPENRRPRAGVMELLLGNTEGSKQVLIRFLFFQGWRITETLSLRWEKVNLRERTMEVYVSKVGRWQTIPMADDVFEALAPIAREEGRVFRWSSRSGVYNWLRPLCKKLGITFTPHMARHDFGGQLREAGATARDLVDVGTWTHEQSTSRYQHAGSDHNRNIISRRKVGE